MPSALVESMIQAARAAQRVLLGHFANRGALEVRAKGPADLVSQADVEAEAAIVNVLERADPSARFEGEEMAARRVSRGRRFVIDPLDGTTNFLRGIPHFCISIACAEDARILAGVVLDPVRDELFWAESGQGAYLGQERLTLAHAPTPKESLVHTGMPNLSPEARRRFLAQFGRILAEVAFIRRLGAAALDLAYVAAGRGDGFFEPGLKPWDIAAGSLLVREAGGIVTDHAGGDDMLVSGDIIAASVPLHGVLLAALTREDG